MKRNIHFGFFLDYKPAINSENWHYIWLGIDKGATWTHNGQQLNYTNWVDGSHGNKDRASTMHTDSDWRWKNELMVSEKNGFVCEKDI